SAGVVAQRRSVYPAGASDHGCSPRGLWMRANLDGICGATFALISAVLVIAPASAQRVEDVYRGKTINLYIGTTPGGGYDLYARLVARFLGAHIPGNPTVLPRNMPGAGSRTAAGYVY